MPLIPLLALVQAAGAPAPVTVPPTGPVLTEAIRARDAELFELFFQECEPARLATLLMPDFEMYHDRNGVVARSAATFVADYAKNCPAAVDPNGMRHRRDLIPSSLQVEAVPGFGAIEEGDHDFFEGEAGGPMKKTGTAHFVHLWQLTTDGWKLARVLSYSHRAEPGR